jgi:hypothetical protein
MRCTWYVGRLLQRPFLGSALDDTSLCKQDIYGQLRQLHLDTTALAERSAALKKATAALEAELSELVQAPAAKDQQLDSTAQDMVRSCLACAYLQTPVPRTQSCATAMCCRPIQWITELAVLRHRAGRARWSRTTRGSRANQLACCKRQ